MTHKIKQPAAVMCVWSSRSANIYAFSASLILLCSSRDEECDMLISNVKGSFFIITFHVTSSHFVAIPVAGEDNYMLVNCLESGLQIGWLVLEAQMKAGEENHSHRGGTS